MPICLPSTVWNPKSILQTALHNSCVSASYLFMQKRHGPGMFSFFHTYHMGNKDSIATVPPPTEGLLVLDPILVLILPRSTSCSPVLRSNFPWPLAKVHGLPGCIGKVALAYDETCTPYTGPVAISMPILLCLHASTPA